MTREEIVRERLARQFLQHRTDVQHAAKALCGVQAQYLSHALHALAIRCGEVDTAGLIRGWTNRGTMHLFAECDLSLFLHEGRRHFLRPMDTMETDAYTEKQRKTYFAGVIEAAIGDGIRERDALRDVCRTVGMTETEEQGLFDPWGGIIRAMCESGRICQLPQEKKAYRICPAFEPMSSEEAWLEKAKRYFTHYGPATVKDAAYFYGVPQKQVRGWLDKLPVTEIKAEGQTFYRMGETGEAAAEIPQVILLAGFDPLMLGYDKTESLLLDRAHIGDVFTRAGIVRPVVLVNGHAAGWWSRKNGKMQITLFSAKDREAVEEALTGRETFRFV